MERSGRSLLVPESRAAMDALKKDVLRDNALQQASQSPEAKDGGELTSRQAGKIGGPIGGSMVKRLVEIAEEQLAQSKESDGAKNFKKP
jgi:small acid-soluble spore protein D (minor alpha/beta-type SASP)